MTTKKKYQYVVCSKTASSMNNERCWMNIGKSKLKKAAESKEKYWFVCSIEGNTCVYSAVATELKDAFEEYNVVIMGNKQKQTKYSFYLDYGTGEVFAKVSRNDKDVVIKLKVEEDRIQVDKGDVVSEEPSYFKVQEINLVKYKELSNKGKEIYNIQKLCSLLAEYGFECQRLVNDSEGPDIIAYRSVKGAKTNPETNENVFLIQVKGRMTIKKAYQDKKLHIAFPVEEGWYIFPHDDTISHIVPPNWLETKSWGEGFYHVKKLPEKLKKQMAKYLVKWPEGKQNQ